jgi:hypothetical protein
MVEETTQTSHYESCVAAKYTPVCMRLIDYNIPIKRITSQICSKKITTPCTWCFLLRLAHDLELPTTMDLQKLVISARRCSNVIENLSQEKNRTWVWNMYLRWARKHSNWEWDGMMETCSMSGLVINCTFIHYTIYYMREREREREREKLWTERSNKTSVQQQWTCYLQYLD